LFDVFVHKEISRAKIFVDFVVEVERISFSCVSKNPPLMHHQYPPASPDSTCPNLLLDNNKEDPRHWRVDDNTKASGCGQFGLHGWQVIRDRINDMGSWRRVMVDLRQEPHGFVDIETGEDFEATASERVVPMPYMACCWMTQHDFGAAGLSSAEARQLEKTFLKMLRRQVEVKLGWPHNSILPFQTYTLKDAKSEKQVICSDEVYKYKRIFVTDHCRPNDDSVDLFVSLVRRYNSRESSDVWYIFHCHGGDGRTTMFLCMYDMLLNACRGGVKYEDFIGRQLAIFKYDLNAVPDDEQFAFKVVYAHHRVEFLEEFFRYCRTDPVSSGALWSGWLQTQ
jgi:hypothetical protein